MKIKLAIMFSIVTVLIMGCGASNEVEYSAGKFSIDRWTIREAEAWNAGNSNESSGNGNAVKDPNISTGELILEGNDASVKYEISGNDIIYKGITFHDLYYCVQHVQLPCDQNTFINFLVKTYQTKDSDVYSEYVNDYEFDTSSGEENITIHENFSDSSKYLALVDEYGKEANWTLTVYEYGYKSPGMIIGCDKYLMYNGGSGEHTVDMSKFDY